MYNSNLNKSALPMEGHDDENYNDPDDDFDDSCTEQIDQPNVYKGTQL